MRLDELLDPGELASAIDQGHITRKPHPDLPLSILTYTRACQYDNIWNPVTMTCRGLIVDSITDEVVAYPFPKIFVTDMHNRGFDFAPPLPDEPFTICEKLDGSLIIVFHYDGRWHVASKGSFISEQARWAQAWIEARDTSRLDPKLTYLAEAIYPGNRIVVDYGTVEELVLLAAFRSADGTEEVFGFSLRQAWAPIGRIARSWGMRDDITEVVEMAASNLTVQNEEVSGQDEEGYVIRFASGQRAKIKLASYLALHKLFTGTNERTVWEALASGHSPSVLFDQAPDEFADWVREVAERLECDALDLRTKAKAEFSAIGETADRKEFALCAVKSPYASALFQLYDDRDIRLWSFKQIKPRGDQPFKMDEDN